MDSIRIYEKKTNIQTNQKLHSFLNIGVYDEGLSVEVVESFG